MRMKMLEARDICVILNMALANAYKLMKRPDFPAIQISARRYVVPEKAFWNWLDEQIEKKKIGNICVNCGQTFKSENRNTKYCPECGEKIRAQQNRDRVKRFREKHNEG